jgi:ABC-type transport system involved in cytochrome bd biosynthesis fused ATPase/permease subunit
VTGAAPAWSSDPASPGRRQRLPGTDVRLLVDVARPWLAGAIAVGVGQSLLLVAQAAVLARLLSAALSGGLTARATTEDSLLVVLLALGQGLAGWAWETCTERAAQRARGAARQRALARSIRLAASSAGIPGRSGDDPGPGGVAALLGPGIDELDPFVGRVLPRAVLAVAVPALLLAWIAHLDLLSAGLAGLALVFGPVLAALVGIDTAAAVRRRLAGLERLADRFAGLVGGLALLRAFGRARDHERSVAASGEEVRAATLATLRLALLTGLVLELLAAVGTALVAVPLGLRLDSGHRILPQALAVLILTPEVFVPLRRLAADFHAGSCGRAALARLGRLGAPDGSAPDGGWAPDGRTPSAGRSADGTVSGQPVPEPLGIALESVSLTAASRSRPVLDRIDLHVCPGERVCLTGESGAGKSSLLRVVAGLVIPTAGQARLEGRELAAGRRPALAWVPQHPTVLAATVLDNVALGRPGIDAEAARAALDAAQLGPWLAGLPRGLYTRLSGLDERVSLGERRRLAVARVLAGPRAGLWLLDEPTAGLDSATARLLLEELRQVVGGATALIATHDVAALTLGQRVAELDHGRLVAVRPGREGRPRATAGVR